VLQLCAALTARGHRVVQGAEAADIHVAINDARLLPEGARRSAVWFHNEVGFWREARRLRLAALLRHRPVAIFCGPGQAHASSRLLPFRARAALPLGLPPAILSASPAAAPPPPHALFISQAYRGLEEVIALWRTQVAPACRHATLAAYIAPADIPRFKVSAAGIPSIAILPRIGNALMPALLREARLLLAPGHPSETFCLSAAEAIAMGVPVVTRGIGALKERVRDGHTGFICRSAHDMAHRTLALLTDDALWLRMQAAGLATRHNAGWDRIAQHWETLLADRNA
jgi:glycosyltransferase involved in cell wall biosynthesis